MRLRQLVIFLVSGYLFSASAEASKCVKLWQNSPKNINKLVLPDYVVKGCYENSRKILELLKKQNWLSVEKAKVLYITDILSFRAHVVVEFNGFIIDARNINYSSKVVPVLKAKDYFAISPALRLSEVRVIPAMDYLRDFYSFSEFYYLAGLNNYRDLYSFGISKQIAIRYPIISFQDYLQREFPEDQVQ